MVALRHDSVSILERLMDLPLRADKALSTEIKLPVHRTNAGAVAGGDSNSKSKETTLAAGERCVPLLLLHLRDHKSRLSFVVVGVAGSCHQSSACQLWWVAWRPRARTCLSFE